MSIITQELLKEALEYNPATGQFLWLKPHKFSSMKCGDIAGNICPEGYRSIGFMHKDIRAHRLAFLWMEGYLPENLIDHINGIRYDNRWCNLRNKKSLSASNKSGITGVCWHKLYKKWAANIGVNNKSVSLGKFTNLVDAIKARWEGEKLYNYPNCQTTSSAYKYLIKHNFLN